MLLKVFCTLKLLVCEDMLQYFFDLIFSSNNRLKTENKKQTLLINSTRFVQSCVEISTYNY